MEYLGFIFGIFGLMAYLNNSSLAGRVSELENEIAKISGTSFERKHYDLVKIIKSNIGKKVKFDLKEDCEDVDIVMNGIDKNGSNTIIDTDGEWILVRTVNKKGCKEKLIRVSSVEKISIEEMIE
ncbi:MAG: hypothetical protein K6E13_08740 [Lachnospiraceae bacterium]|nr:hypothetical protein [Lachnospiraceae bacterium]